VLGESRELLVQRVGNGMMTEKSEEGVMAVTSLALGCHTKFKHDRLPLSLVISSLISSCWVPLERGGWDGMDGAWDGLAWAG
jgi:hypothetical protein